MPQPTKHRAKTFLLPGLVGGTIAVAMIFDLHSYLTLASLKEHQASFAATYAAKPLVTLLGYFVVYVVATAVSFPGAAVLTLAGGALFGFWTGLLVVSFASTLGATAAFLLARVFLREQIERRFSRQLKAINAGIAKDGAFYLFTLRLVPVVPFFVINLGMGLTTMATWKFFVVSQVGMLLGTAAYVNAGTQLAKIESMSGILSTEILVSFAILGIFPWVARGLLDWLKRCMALRKFRRPKRYDYNIVVIGAGSGGLVAAYIAAAVKAKVALIEKHRMGGDCLNTGCVPSKALIKSAKIVALAKKAQDLGLRSLKVEFEFADIMQRVQRVIRSIEPHDSRERYEKLGVECISGEARILSPFEVQVGTRTLTTKNIIIATGARPMIPDIPGLASVPYLTSDSLWGLKQKPSRMLILGGGPIGCELAQAFQRLGTQVILVERESRLLAREDSEVSQHIEAALRADGVEVLLGHEAKDFSHEGAQKTLRCSQDGANKIIAFDEVLIAVGREARVTGFGAEELGLELDKKGRFASDPFMRTNISNVFVCGDVTGDLQFTHVASHEAWYASVNALFGPRFVADYRVIPMVTFTDPEVARVGLNEREAKERGISYEVSHYGIDDLDRAIADEEAEGFVKVLTVSGKDKILGVTIVGSRSGDILAEYVLAMRHGLGLNKILGTTHAYPTFAEANKYAAGVWKRAHAPQGALQWLEKFHAWRRGD